VVSVIAFANNMQAKIDLTIRKNNHVGVDLCAS